MKRPRALSRLGILLALTSMIPIAGCAPAATPAATPSYIAVISATLSTSATLQPLGTTLTYPVDDGYYATFAYAANNASSGTTAALTTITNPMANLVPMGRPPGTMLIAYELTLNQNVTFTTWNGFVSSVELPLSIQTSGHSFAEYGYDITLGVASGIDPGTVTGLIVSFPAGRPPVTLLANHTYLMIIAMQ